VAVEIREASTPEDYSGFATLIREYFEWMFARYGKLRGFIEAVGGHQGIDAELQDLSATFGPPEGKALIAWHNNEANGCVAYKDAHDGSAEMKRLFVPERFQGQGLGRRLAEAVVDQARADGFTHMRLDTGFLHEEAMAMYASMGFQPCEAYIDYPPDLLPHMRFFEREL
jgi:GNAT superfamily N-acetyltransferase